MGIISSLLGIENNAAFPGSPFEDFWYKDAPGRSGFATRYAVSDPDSAMHVAAFFNGVRILAETLAQVKLILYERTGTNGENKERAINNPLYYVLHDQPNEFQTSYEFRVQAMIALLLRGDAFAEVRGGLRGAVESLRPLMPHHMDVLELTNGRLGYAYREKNGTTSFFTQDEMFHVRGFPIRWDGIRGLSVLGFARQTIGMALTTEAYGIKLFENGALHRGAFSTPNPLKKEQREAIRQEIQRVHAGEGGWHSSMVLESGAKWEAASMSAQDAEFLTTRKFSVVEVARWLNIQPHLIKDLDRSTNNNIEQQSLEFLTVTMAPHFVNWEQAINRDLIVQKNRFFAEFLLDSIVRADIKSRYEAYGAGIDKGFLSRNEVRQRENLNREPGLEKFLVDQNKATVESGGQAQPISLPKQNPANPLRQLPRPEEQRRAAHYERLLLSSAERIVSKESRAITKALAKMHDRPQELAEWASKYYEDHASFMVDVMQIEEEQAREFSRKRQEKLLLSVKDNCVKSFEEQLELTGVDEVLELVKKEETRGSMKRELFEYQINGVDFAFARPLTDSEIRNLMFLPAVDAARFAFKIAMLNIANPALIDGEIDKLFDGSKEQ